MAKQAQGGWRRTMSGMYFYTNAAGKDLAFVERYRSFWNITVYVKGEHAGQVTLSASPKTLREAKRLAENAYKHLTVQALKEERAVLKLHGHI